ncbi:MAG TPA: FtsH protease activity modulator HflK [Dehalococcoidia bacterium]|jgi:membrane protease subunit HflK|nr:FtsH protease activity modulator HflK [Dehalococcoidia bacterium]HIK89825.1 FtsH protease activity modulator HflK [Dehalococcoidia bacterium]
MAAPNDDTQVVDNKMYRPPQQEEAQLTLDEVIERLKASLPKIPGIGGTGSVGLIFLALIVIAIIWAGTGFYTVGPEQEAVLRTFGKFTATTSGGLHWHYPGPIGKRNVVAVTTARRMELGFRSGSDGFTVAQSVTNESLMITGDENIVDVQAVVQYRISSLQYYLFEVDDPGDTDRGVRPGQPDGRTLRDIAETALRQVVGARNIDDVLTTEKEQVQTDVLLKMRELATEYKTGIDVLQVLLQNVNPPLEVQSAFEDVVRAREDRERLINLAEAYEAAEIPKATGEAAKITEAAEGFKQGRIARAQGEADGFNAILDGYEGSPEITRQRLYLEAMEEILPGITKFILSDSAVLPFLPLSGATGGTGTIIGTGGGQ